MRASELLNRSKSLGFASLRADLRMDSLSAPGRLPVAFPLRADSLTALCGRSLSGSVVRSRGLKGSMHRRCAFFLLAGCAWLAARGAQAASGVSVYGLELEVTAEGERLLIFADARLEPRLIPVDDRTLMVALPGSVLDPSAPTQLTPTA